LPSESAAGDKPGRVLKNPRREALLRASARPDYGPVTVQEAFMLRKSARYALATLVLSLGPAGCGGEEIKYEPRKPTAGVKASLPPVPNVPQKPIKQGDGYTIWGASYHLRSRVHRKEVAGKKLTLTGYITKTNLLEAPECAVHKGGEADPEDCKPPIPAFWIGDTKDATEADSIKVMGWASNFAQIFDAIDEYDSKGEEGEHLDTFWGIKVPNPLPAKGAKVTVSGNYSTTFTGASAGAEADPIMGLMHYQEMKVLEPVEELATLPGKKRKPPPKK
jgi:hypothetical protein